MSTARLEQFQVERDLIKAITLEPVPQLNTEGLEYAARNYAAAFSNQSVNAAAFLSFMEGYRTGRKNMMDTLVEPARDQAHQAIKAYEQILIHLHAACAQVDKRNAELDEMYNERLQQREHINDLNAHVTAAVCNVERLEKELQEANSNHVNKDLQIEVNNLTYQLEQKENMIVTLSLYNLQKFNALQLLHEVISATEYTQDVVLRQGAALRNTILEYLKEAKEAK